MVASNSMDKDRWTPVTVGPIKEETHATAWEPAPSNKRARSWTPVTVGITAEETPATA